MTKEEKQKIFIEYYRENECTYQEAIDQTGVISRSGFNKWKKDEDFLDELHRDDSRMMDQAESVLYIAMRDGSSKVDKIQVDTAKWYLERKGGYHKVASEQNINVNHRAIAQIEVPDMTEDKFAAIGAKAQTVSPTDEEDIMALAKDRFGEEFTFEMPDE